jgi:ATP phosphoribosyltransferase
MVDGKQMRIGIPKGSLEEATVKLFAKAGWKVTSHHRNYFPEINDPELTCSLCRAQEMARYVESGLLDAGLTGKDWILENQSDVVIVDDLIYSKVSNRPAKWVLAVAGDSPYKRPEDLAGKKIATEFVGFTKRYFEDAGIAVDVEYSWGATEAKVVEGLVDAIVEITETGTTIKAHGLRIIAELLADQHPAHRQQGVLERSLEAGQDREHEHPLAGCAQGRQAGGPQDECSGRRRGQGHGPFAEHEFAHRGPSAQFRLAVHRDRGRDLPGPGSGAEAAGRGGAGHHRVLPEQGHLITPPFSGADKELGHENMRDCTCFMSCPGRLRSQGRLQGRVLEHGLQRSGLAAQPGRVAHQQQSVPAGLQELLKVEAAAKHMSRFHFDSGMIYLGLQELEQSREGFARAVEIDEDFGEAWNNLGKIEEALGRDKEAEAAYRKAFSILTYVTPEFSAYNLGVLLLRQGRAKEAEEFGRKALARNWLYIPAYKLLADAFVAQNRLDDAEDVLKSGLEADMNSTVHHPGPGGTQDAHGQDGRGGSAFRSYRQTVPQFQ